MKKLKMISGVAVLLSMLLSGVVLADEAGVQDLPGSGWWSGETEQNIGTGDATVVGVAYDLDSTATYNTTSFTIPQGGAVTILPESFGGSPVFSGMDGHRGTAVISSDQPLVAIVNVTNRQVGSLAGVAGGYAAGVYEGTSGDATGTQLNFPIAKNNTYPGKDTTVFVQNAGSTAAMIYGTFYYSGGSSSWNSGTNVEPGAGVVIPSDSMPNATQGSLVVTSTQPLAGVHTEHESNESGASVSQVLKTTKAFVPDDGDDVLYAPSFKKGYGAIGLERSSAMGIQAQADGVSGQIEYTCALGNCTAGSTVTVNFGPLDTGESYVAWPYNADHAGLTDVSFYSAKITATGGNIVATVDETGFNAGGTTTSPNRDTTYSAIPEQDAAATWVCPVVKERYFDNAGAPVVFAAGSNVTVDVEYTVSGSESGSYVGNTYTINDFAILNGNSAAFFDVAYSGVPGISWLGGSALPSDTGINASVRIVATGGNIVAIANENVHYLSSLLQDAKQYSCFPVP